MRRKEEKPQKNMWVTKLKYAFHVCTRWSRFARVQKKKKALLSCLILTHVHKEYKNVWVSNIFLKAVNNKTQDGFVELWSGIVTIEAYLKFEHVIFGKITYFLSGLYGPNLGNFLKRREHALNGYISFMLRQYIDTPKDLAWLGKTARILQNICEI